MVIKPPPNSICRTVSLPWKSSPASICSYFSLPTSGLWQPHICFCHWFCFFSKILYTWRRTVICVQFLSLACFWDFIHVVVCINTSFLLIVGIAQIYRTQNIQFVYPFPIGGHLSCFHLGLSGIILSNSFILDFFYSPNTLAQALIFMIMVCHHYYSETFSKTADGGGGVDPWSSHLWLWKDSTPREAAMSRTQADMKVCLVCYNVIYHPNKPSGTWRSATKCSIQYL